MRITRRVFAYFLLLSPLFFSVAGGSADKLPANRKYLVFVGTYTTKTESKGIYAYEFDTDTGKLTPKGVAAETPDPSWLAVHPSGKFLYAANEAGKASTVAAFAVDAKSGNLALLNQIPSLGEDPCYLSFDKTGKYVLVANYSSGTVAVFPILKGGRLGAHTAMVKDQGGTGPNKKRQEGPHAHWVQTTPDNRFALVADLGLDEIVDYRFDASNGALIDRLVHLSVAPGSGPRHFAFHPNGSFAYILNELKSTATVLLVDSKDSALISIQTISTLPKSFSGRNDAAEIAVHPDGRFLYTSNRGHDSIAVFAIDPGEGTLKLVAHVPTGGKEPRHFAIDPSGKYLLAENQFSNNIVVFKIDAATGGLAPTGQIVQVPSPVDLTFVAAE